MPALTPDVIGARVAGYLAARGSAGAVPVELVARLASEAFTANNVGASVAGAVLPLLGGVAGRVADLVVRALLAAVDPGVVVETGRIEWRDER